MMAISNRSIERARVLIENGADVNYMDKDYCNALTEAVDINSIPIVQLLIDRGANVNPPMPHGKYTPLMSAIFSNYYDMIECLIMNGAMVGDLELDLARQEDDSDMAEYLQLCLDLRSREAA